MLRKDPKLDGSNGSNAELFFVPYKSQLRSRLASRSVEPHSPSGLTPEQPDVGRAVFAGRMQDIRSESVLCALDRSLALFSQLRTPDPVSVTAYDTLKQARAMIERALSGEVPLLKAEGSRVPR